MNSTILRRTILITLLVLIVPVMLLTLFAESANCQTVVSAHQNDVGIIDAHAPSCPPFLSPRLSIGIGEIQGQIRYGRRSDTADSNEPLPACASDSPFAIRVDWMIGRTSIWSFEI